MITSLNHQCVPALNISFELKRSKTAVWNFLKNRKRVYHCNSAKNNKNISKMQQILLVRMAYSGNYSASDFRRSLNIPIGVRRIQQIISKIPHFKYRKMVSVPRLTLENINKLLYWARLHVTKGESFWFQTIFSDEK